MKPPAAVADSFRSEALTSTVTVDPGDLYGSIGEFAFEQPLQLTPAESKVFGEEKQYPEPPGQDPETDAASDKFFSIVSKHHGVRIGGINAVAVLRGLSNQTVHISNLRIKYLERTPVWTGGVFCESNEGGEPVDQVGFDLDSDNPVPQALDPTTSEPTAPLFNTRQFTLERGEVLSLDLHFEALRRYVKFDPEVDWDTPTKSGTYELTNQGDPFEISGPATPESFGGDGTVSSLAGYRTAWVVPPEGPVKSVTPGRPEEPC